MGSRRGASAPVDTTIETDFFFMGNGPLASGPLYGRDSALLGRAITSIRKPLPTARSVCDLQPRVPFTPARYSGLRALTASRVLLAGSTCQVLLFESVRCGWQRGNCDWKAQTVWALAKDQEEATGSAFLVVPRSTRRGITKFLCTRPSALKENWAKAF